jgi:hypothetical protein
MGHRALAAFLAFALLLAPAATLAQSSTGQIDLTVVDTATGKPLGNVRTFLLGAQTANALTTASGAITFTDVPVGIYRVRLQLRGYDGASTRSFDVLPDRSVHVSIRLTKRAGSGASSSSASTATSGSNSNKIIGTVTARNDVSITTTDISADSPIRRLSDSLADALDKLAGVSVTTDATDPNSPIQISLNNQDESQTALSLDGIPLSAPGSAGNLRGIGTDLFSGSSVSFAPTAGGLAGSVNFSTLQPTQALQFRANGTDGTFDRWNDGLAATGSIGNLGFVVEHTDRGSNSPLTFRDYEDQSGLTYPHGGESMTESDLFKLRYELGDERTSITATGLDTNRDSAAICAQDVTILPCGIGPNNTSYGRYALGYLTVQSLIGNIETTASGYVNAGSSYTNDLDRYVLALAPGAIDPTDPANYEPTLDPSESFSAQLTRGIAYSASLAEGNHTFILTGNTYAAINSSTPLAGSPYVTAFTNAASSSRYQFSDDIKSNDQLTLSPNVSFADTSGIGGSFLAGISSTWRPKVHDTYALAVNVGSSQPNLSAVASFSDPVSARFNCQAQTAVVSGPGDTGDGVKQSSFSVNASWQHQFNGGATITISPYTQLQSGQLINAQIEEPLSYFDAAGAGYLQNVDAAYRSPTVCGVNAAAPTVLVQEAIAGTRRLYQGVNVNARFELSPYIALIPSYSLNLAVLESAGSRLDDGPSTTIVGAQLPNRPIHKGNLTLDGLMPRSGVEFLANAQFVGANNQQNLGPYINVSFGVSHRFGPGQLTLFENNAFNTYAGDFATSEYSRPLPLSFGGSLPVAATPLTPRTIFLSYAMVIGGPAPGPAFRGLHGSRVALGPQPSPSPSAAPRFQRITPYPPPAGTDPLSLATARDACTTDAQTAATPMYAALRAYVAAYEKGDKTPDVPNLTVEAHTTATGSEVAYYLELRPHFVRPPGAPQGGGGGLGRRGGGFGGPGGGGPDGGGPPIASGEVTAQSGPPSAVGDPAARRRNAQQSATFVAYRSFVGCAYVSVLSADDAKAKGIDVQGGRAGLIYVPGIGITFVQPRKLPQGGGSVTGAHRPAPSASPSPSASSVPSPSP